MTPGARISAMIEVLDSILVGVPTEKALTNWGRGNRFAGSKDRAAIRDLVFQAVRCRRSAGAWPKPISARAWAIGSLQTNGVKLENLFNNIGHAPTPSPMMRSLHLKVLNRTLLTYRTGSLKSFSTLME
jgi:16S rRNA (cytosine967-C5)-methyltransferase